MIITIDGPSGTGKSTVARKVAERLGFVYFDTGAMYRAFTWFVIQHSVDIHDQTAVQRLLEQFDFKIQEKEGEKRYFVGGHDVTIVIRSRLVTAQVSAISALKQVRSHLLKTQHEFGMAQNAVFEGRDLGTAVFPQAEIKIFLTAEPLVRAERRLTEVLQKKPEEAWGVSRLQMLADLMARDEYDSTREVAPLRCPEDAYQIDTTHLSIDQVVDLIVKYCSERFPDKIRI